MIDPRRSTKYDAYICEHNARCVVVQSIQSTHRTDTLTAAPVICALSRRANINNATRVATTHPQRRRQRRRVACRSCKYTQPSVPDVYYLDIKCYPEHAVVDAGAVAAATADTAIAIGQSFPNTTIECMYIWCCSSVPLLYAQLHIYLLARSIAACASH